MCCTIKCDFYSKCTKMRLAAGLRLDPLESLLPGHLAVLRVGTRAGGKKSVEGENEKVRKGERKEMG